MNGRVGPGGRGIGQRILFGNLVEVRLAVWIGKTLARVDKSLHGPCQVWLAA